MGVHCAIHKDGDKVIIFTDDGSDCTDRLPSVVKEVLALPEKELILDVEIEIWKGKEHFGREFVSGYLHENGGPDDSGIVVHLFGVLWYPEIGDIHKKTELERLSYLEKLSIKQGTIGIPSTDFKLRKVPYDLCRTPAKFKVALQKYSEAPAAEGAMIKIADQPYSLSGSSSAIIKFKKYIERMGIVWRVNRTKMPTIFNYDFAVDFKSADDIKPESMVEIKGRKYTKAGRTYNTDTKCQIGDVIKIRLHTINLYKDPRTGFHEIHFYEPIFH